MGEDPQAPQQGAAGSELRKLIKLAIPIALAQAGQASMGLVDTAVVGRIGARALAATGLANALFFTVSIFGVGLVLGIDPLVAQAIGARDTSRARVALWQGAWLALAASVVLLPVLIVAGLLLPRAGLSPELSDLTWHVLVWRLPGLLPMLLFFAQRSYLQALERTRAIVAATVIANLLNLAFDIWWVFGGRALHLPGPLAAMPALGAVGSALSTSTCTLVQLAILSVAVMRVGGPAGSRHRALHPAILRSAMAVGVPVGLHYTAEVGVFAFAGLLAGRLGDVSLAAHQVALVYASFSFCVAVGIGTAGGVRVGHAVGAHDTRLARRSGFTALASGASFMALAAMLFMAFRRPLATLISDKPDVAAAAVPLLAVTAVFQVSDGLQGIGAGVLRGAGDSRFTLLANLIGHYGIGLPLALFLLSRGGGVTGIWWGLCAGLTSVAFALSGRFWRLSSREIVPVTSSSGAP